MESFEWNFGFFHLELSCLLKEFVNLKKIVKNKFLNRPSLTNPTDNDDEANKKYVDEKTETIDLSSFSLKHAGRNRFIETFIREKATCWFHADHNSNSQILHQNKLCVTFDQSGLNNATQDRKFHSRKGHFFEKQLKTLFPFFDLPFIINLFILSVFSVIKISKGSTRGTKIYT